MRLLGVNGAGYELAQRLEENAVWRAWLGERDYTLLQAYLATPGTWSAFMQTENPSVIALQLRVRALLFDKALVALHLDSAAASPPSALDNSFLQLHADSVYFTLEQDAEDWTRLQAEKNPALASLQVKHGLDSSATFSRSSDAESGHGGINSRPNKAPQSSQSVSSALISPRQLASRTHAKTGFNIAGHAIDHRSLGELWYTQYLQRDLMNRMNRLARRTAQRGLPFGDQEACLRTPTEMSDYVCNQANHRKRRPVFRVVGDLKQSLSGHERSVQGDDSALFMPENQFPGNCVPDNAIPARQNLSLDGFSAHGAFLDRLNHLRDLSSGLFIRGKDRLGPAAEVSNQQVRKDTVGRGNSKDIGRKNGCSEEAAQQLAEQAVVRLVAEAGFEGLKQAPLQILADLLRCHVQKLGSALRRTVDTYKMECSQAELLKICIHGASGSKLEELMEYAKSTQPQKRRPAPVQMPQPTIQQALVQQQISPHPVSMSMGIPYQHIQGQEIQSGCERFAKRRQSSSPRGSNGGDRFGLSASDAKPGGEFAIESATVADGLSQILNQTYSQGHLSWGPQAPNFAVLPQVHQPPILQRFKQQLSSLQIPSLQQNSSLYVRDSGALKLASPQIQGLVDISVGVSIKNELDDQGEGSQFSPSSLAAGPPASNITTFQATALITTNSLTTAEVSSSLYVRDSGALKLASPQIQGLVDISVGVSIKNELDDQGEGSQFSPSSLAAGPPASNITTFQATALITTNSLTTAEVSSSLYVRDSGALKLASPQIQGLVDISVGVSIKNELDDQGEGSQFSPSRRKRNQNQRSWGFTE